jgi:hypothetical protein
MQPISIIKRASFLTVFATSFFLSGALFGRKLPSAEASCPAPPRTGDFSSDRKDVATFPGVFGEADGGVPTYEHESDRSIVFIADGAEPATGCQSAQFDLANGTSVLLAYEQLEAIAWNADATVLVVEHPAHQVIIEGAHLDLLRDRFREHACETIAATPPSAAENGGATASEEADDASEPYIARVRAVLPVAYYFGKQGQYVSGEEFP